MTRLLWTIPPLMLLVVWQLAAALHWVDALFLPSPASVGGALIGGLRGGSLLSDLVATTLRAAGGLAISVVVGLPSGLLLGRRPVLSAALQPTLDFFRSVPATAIFPLLLLAFGVGDAAKLAVVVYGSTLIVLVYASYGARQVKVARLQSARVLGLSRSAAFWKIIVPEASPSIFAGVRVALSLAFVLVVVTEMFIGTHVGLGARIVEAQGVYRMPDVYAAVFLTGALGYAGNRILLFIEQRVVHWEGR